MTQSNPINLPSSPAPASQGTVIESSRAMAEVAAMVRIAQDNPRNTTTATSAMEEACAQHALAAKAFFSFPRAGGAVNGPSIHLARELARVWGNITYGVTELRRDDVKRESEMLAFAWDVQTNTRSAHVFIVPHARDTKSGRKDLVELRDVYENNANAGARRVREAIFAVLPAWFTETAQDLCRQTLERGTGASANERANEALQAFAGYQVTTEQLQAHVGKPPAEWTAADVSRLEVLFRSLVNGEVTVADTFPAPAHATTTKGRVTAAEIGAQS